MTDGTREMITGIILFTLLISGAMWFSGDKNNRPSDRAIERGYEYNQGVTP